MAGSLEISQAGPADAPDIAEIHLAARREAMPYLRLRFTDAHTRDWFTRVVRPGTWWIACRAGLLVGYMRLDGEGLDHLYVSPRWQGQGVGTALLDRAKTLSPNRLALSTFRRNVKARVFYQAHGFRPVGFTDGDNDENEPDVQYEWTPDFGLN